MFPINLRGKLAVFGENKIPKNTGSEIRKTGIRYYRCTGFYRFSKYRLDSLIDMYDMHTRYIYNSSIVSACVEKRCLFGCLLSFSSVIFG